MTTTDVLPANLDRAEKAVLKDCEAEIQGAILDVNRCRLVVGQALWAIQTEKLWRGKYDNLHDYAHGRWGISRSAAYRLIQIAQTVAAHPELPIPAQWELEPGKRASKAAGKPTASPTDGTEPGADPSPPAPSEPPVLDVEGWEEPAPAAIAERSEAQSPADFATSADAVRAAIEAVERVQEATENVEISSLEAPAPAVTAQSPDQAPVVVTDAKTAIEADDGPDDAWSAENVAAAIAEIDRLPRPADIEDVPPPPTPTAAWKHLLDHLQDCDPLDMAAVVSDDGYQIWVEWNARFTPAVAKRFAKMATPRKAAAKKVAPVKAAASTKPPIAQKVNAPLDRTNVTPMFKTPKVTK